MLQFLTFASAAADSTPGYMTAETLQTGISTTAIGMIVVFLVLIVLYLFVKVVGGVMGSLDKKSAAGKAAAKKADETPAPAVAAPVVEEPATGLSPKTVAAIMAAVSLASGKPMAQLRFQAVRRVRTVNNSWAASGTNEIINTRQQYL